MQVPDDLASVVIQSILIFLTLLVTGLLWALPDSRKDRNGPLCALLVLSGYHTVLDLTVEVPLLGSLHLHLIGGALVLMYAPLIYLYARRTLGYATRRWFLHGLPGILGVVYASIYGFSHALFFSLLVVQYAAYVWMLYAELARTQQLATPIGRWLQFVVVGFGGLWLLAVTTNLLGSLGYDGSSDYLELLLFTLAIVYFSGLVYAVVVRTQYFRRADPPPPLGRKPAQLGLGALDRMRELDRLLRQDKLYLDADLDRSNLANHFQITVQQLSTEINAHFALNLAELINGHRVEEARVRLVSTEHSIKEICYSVGFNSRSAFNANFKKQTGLTPTEFRKSPSNMS